MRIQKIERWAGLFLFLLLIPGILFGQPPRSPTKSTGSERFVTIDFNNVDINVFIKFISELTGRNFIVDQRVRGKVTIISPAKISVDEAYTVFESVLEVHGFSTVKSGSVTKIIPDADARTKNIETRLKKEMASPEDKVVTQLIPLKYASSDEIRRLFTPLISKSSVALSYPATNVLIVTDVYSNITRLMRILEAIDVAGIGHEISVVPLQFAEATKMAKILESVFMEKTRGKKGETPKVIEIVADERTNTIVLVASEVDTGRIKSLVNLLDKEVPKGKEKIHVYYLENATAEDLAKTLQALPSKEAGAKEGKRETPVVPDTVRITADKATNSLIVMAEKDEFLVIEEIIKKLDIPRAMVYIESVIMEVTVEKDFSVGTEWVAAGKTTIQGQDAIYGGGFGDPPPTAPVTGLPSGFSVGVFGDLITVGGVTFPSIQAMITALQKDKDIHILSTPQILTTDNEEATIIVGRNVPFQTRSAAENATDTYSSFEYRDVGITLKITPQISKDRMVRLNIAQEVTKLDDTVTSALGSTDRPTTLKRSIDTTVIVEDSSTVVIGGLIDDSFTVRENKVPLLGDIPILGWLFKSHSRKDEKSNLYVFLTPRVVKSPAEATEIYEKKKSDSDAVREGSIKMYGGGKSEK